MAKTVVDYNKNTKTLISSKKVDFINQETGEIITVDQINKMVYGSKNFWKCYLMDFLAILGIIDSKQVDIFVYIAENTNPSNNMFIGTYKKISKDVGVSEPTISRMMKKMQENNFIKKVQNGVWQVNPNILMKGDDRKRQILLSYYQSDEPINQITMNRTKREQINIKPTESQTNIYEMIEQNEHKI